MAERPVLLASANAMVGMADGLAVLRAGGSALDAAQAVVRVVEDNADDHTVGYGGYPNILGEVELDAAVMDGRDRRAGAVAGLSGFRHPVDAARLVMERLPHVLLVGAGAARFADECGLERRDMLTDEAAATYRRGLQYLGEDFSTAGPLADAVGKLVLDPEHVTGTVNVIARDADGHLASVTSTSGWAWKYPGRAGDTGLIGAGNYCDDRAGAATCTGWGELAIRGGVARAVVLAMSLGVPVAEACARVLGDLPEAGVQDAAETPLHVLAIDAEGGHAAMSTTATSKYAYWDGDLGEPELRARAQRSQQEDR